MFIQATSHGTPVTICRVSSRKDTLSASQNNLVKYQHVLPTDLATLREPSAPPWILQVPEISMTIPGVFKRQLTHCSFIPVFNHSDIWHSWTPCEYQHRRFDIGFQPHISVCCSSREHYSQLQVEWYNRLHSFRTCCHPECDTV